MSRGGRYSGRSGRGGRGRGTSEAVGKWTMEVEIPGDLVGRFIGEKAKIKKGIERETGAKVFVHKPPFEGRKGNVVSTGTEHQVTRVYEEVVKVVSKGSSKAIAEGLKPKYTPSDEPQGRNQDGVRMREGQRNAEWSYKDMHVDLEISAPKPTIKCLVGNKRANLNKIEGECGVEIKLQDANQAKEFQKVYIPGPIENTLRAADMVKQSLESYQPELDRSNSKEKSSWDEQDLKIIKAKAKIKIIQDAVKHFIGKDGQNIKRIRDATVVDFLDVDNDEDEEGFKTVNVSGYVTQVLEAVQEVQNSMKKFSKREQGSVPSHQPTERNRHTPPPQQNRSNKQHGEALQRVRVIAPAPAAYMTKEQLRSLTFGHFEKLILPIKMELISGDHVPKVILNLVADNKYEVIVDLDL